MGRGRLVCFFSFFMFLISSYCSFTFFFEKFLLYIIFFFEVSIFFFFYVFFLYSFFMFFLCFFFFFLFSLLHLYCHLSECCNAGSSTEAISEIEIQISINPENSENRSYSPWQLIQMQWSESVMIFSKIRLFGALSLEGS